MDHQTAVTAILFDLDGTLLPMDQNEFIHAYFSALAKKVAPLGFAQEPFLASMWKGTGAMLKNDGARTNRESSGMHSRPSGAKNPARWKKA
ncbi:MAG: hypothetical protein PUD73_10075 [bacterium]|nr:hypothetical protein [bacterium]